MKTNSSSLNRQVSRRGVDGFFTARADYRGGYRVSQTPGGNQPALNPPASSRLPQTLESHAASHPTIAETTGGAVPVAPSTISHSVTTDSLQIHTKLPSQSTVLAQQFDMPAYSPPDRSRLVVRKKRRLLKVFMRAGFAVGVIAIVTSGALFLRGYANFHKVFRGTNTVAALSTQRVAPELLKGEGDGRVNILLLGGGGVNHPGGDLTDTMVVLSVDPVNNTAAMLSLPRDLWVKMPVNYFGAYQKLNAAYSSGKYKQLGRESLENTDRQAVEAGFAAVDEAVSQVIGVSINYHVLVDFRAFEKAVDTVRGVTVDVPTELYDPTMAWENANNPVLAPVGLQAMNGKKALMYARSRETTSDFARSERQRQLLIALKQKVLTLGTLSSPTKIDSLMTAFAQNVHTDLTTQAATRLFSIMQKIGDSNIASLSLTSPASLVTTDRVGAASVVRPKAGFNAYSDIQAYVRSQLQDGYLLRERSKVHVVAATEGLRTTTVNTLNTYGYSVTSSAVAQGLPKGIQLVDRSNGTAPYTLHYLQDRYGVAAVTTVPSGVEVSSDAQFVIIAGI